MSWDVISYRTIERVIRENPGADLKTLRSGFSPHQSPNDPPAQKDLMPFGKYKGIDIVDIPSSYLKWCCLQEWFEEKYRGLLKAIDEELKFRDKRGCHFEEDGGRRG